MVRNLPLCAVPYNRGMTDIWSGITLASFPAADLVSYPSSSQSVFYRSQAKLDCISNEAGNVVNV